MCTGFSLKKNFNSFSIDVRINMILCVVYLLRIFKMFHGFMNNPVYTECHRRNGTNFGRVFLMLNYTDITQNTYIQS